jgi:hypothetical protein
LNRLSLNAPRNCVRNSGRNRRDLKMDILLSPQENTSSPQKRGL